MALKNGVDEMLDVLYEDPKAQEYRKTLLSISLDSVGVYWKIFILHSNVSH